ncbi:hypothetical protein OEA41_004980 [Lepraria neglecta]|uniref:Uncharacterized protein n=1 Tax=Lepraria neglecta TaxID=209136 RepID=A0AAD9Z225_9LECA|nr:hypothetical protein OEA41_004980 [Lepraria neglecta]
MVQVAVGDIEKFSFMIEGLEIIAYTIDHYAIFENIYLRSPVSSVVGKLNDALTAFYEVILKYLAKAKHYFEEKSGSRILKGALVSKENLDALLSRIVSTGADVNAHASIVDAEISRGIAGSVTTAAKDQVANFTCFQRLIGALCHGTL